MEEIAPNVDFSRTCGFGGEILHLFNTAHRGDSFYVIQERTVFLIMPSIEFGSQRYYFNPFLVILVSITSKKHWEH